MQQKNQKNYIEEMLLWYKCSPAGIGVHLYIHNDFFNIQKLKKMVLGQFNIKLVCDTTITLNEEFQPILP